MLPLFAAAASVDAATATTGIATGTATAIAVGAATVIANVTATVITAESHDRNPSCISMRLLPDVLALAALTRAFARLRESVADGSSTGAVVQSPMATSVLHKLPAFPGLLVLFLAGMIAVVIEEMCRNRGAMRCSGACSLLAVRKHR